tara:strand:- start:1476 stop:2015 length:540 start_codon:yes stop_codon:yes gene_type:complete
MKLKDILIIALILFIGYFFVSDTFKGKNTHTSSLIIDEVHDTIIIIDSFEVKTLVVDTFYSTKYDTFIREGTYPINKYEYKIKDSLLDGLIIASSPFKPVIDFKYTVKSFNIKESITLQPPTDYSGLFYGGSIVLSPFATELYLDGAKSFKNGNQINLSIGRNFEQKITLYKIGFLRKF